VLRGQADNLDKGPDAFRTISEVAQELDLPQHVLRFWETRFTQIKPMKRGGGRRYYRPDDVELLRGIQHLLYDEGYTIRGVQRLLKENGGRFVQSTRENEAVEADDDAEPAIDGRASPRRFPQAPQTLPPAPTLAPRLAEVSTPIDEADEDDDAEAFNLDEAEPEADASDPADAPVIRTVPSADMTARQPKLSRDDVRKLQAALFELSECRRLLDAALKDDP
jgi:DNA-binding transcriptional MerR regulator